MQSYDLVCINKSLVWSNISPKKNFWKKKKMGFPPETIFLKKGKKKLACVWTRSIHLSSEDRWRSFGFFDVSKVLGNLYTGWYRHIDLCVRSCSSTVHKYKFPINGGMSACLQLSPIRQSSSVPRQISHMPLPQKKKKEDPEKGGPGISIRKTRNEFKENRRFQENIRGHRLLCWSTGSLRPNFRWLMEKEALLLNKQKPQLFAGGWPSQSVFFPGFPQNMKTKN